MVCETCLGQNPYVRMVKLPYGQKLCKIGNVPYQAFRWKAGPAGRYKETIVSFVIAKERNICQACLNDMQYGLPVGVRDQLIKESKGTIALPRSDVGQRYFHDQQAQLQADGQSGSIEDVAYNIQHAPEANQLARFSMVKQIQEARNATAFRNLPKLCSFWLNGTCNRVKRKACPFRPCCGTYVFPELASTHRDIMKTLIDDLNSRGADVVQKDLSSEVKEAFRSSLKGNKDEAIKKRVFGEDELSSKYLGKMKQMVPHLSHFMHRLTLQCQ